MIELTPILKINSKIPMYIQLASFIKQEIMAGRIKQNEKLPSKRKLASHLGLSLNTIQSAYDQLSAEGYVDSKPRSGLYVTSFDSDINPVTSSYQNQKIINSDKEAAVKIDFNSGKIDLEHFPYKSWRRITMQSLYEEQGDLFYTGYPQGELSLREQIAKHVYSSRGVRCSASQIVIGAGTQILMQLLCILIGLEQPYAIEDPGFHRTRSVLHDMGVSFVPIPLDKEGVNVKVLKQSGVRVVYVTPSHQFPAGMVMPISRRMELLKWAEEQGRYIIEDDYDGEYRYKGKPIPSLQGLDTASKVIYLGTFSKSLIPSVRISYIILPPPLLKRYEEHFSIYKQTVSRLHQETLFHFMNEGHWQSHLNKMRTIYRKKQRALLGSIAKYFGKKVQVIGENAGLHILLEVKSGMEEAELIQRAMETGVKVYPLSIYYHEPKDSPKSTVLFGFGGLTEKEIEHGMMLLKGAWGL